MKSEIKKTKEKYKQKINELKDSSEVKTAGYTQQLKEKIEIIVKLETNLSESEKVKQSLKEESETQKFEIKNLKNLISILNKKIEDLDNELEKYTNSEASHKNELIKRIVEINELKNDLNEKVITSVF